MKKKNINEAIEEFGKGAIEAVDPTYAQAIKDRAIFKKNKDAVASEKDKEVNEIVRLNQPNSHNVGKNAQRKKLYLSESTFKETDDVIVEGYVLFKRPQGYAITTKDNYNSRLMNANEIMDFSKFDSAESIIDYIKSYPTYFKGIDVDKIEVLTEDIDTTAKPDVVPTVDVKASSNPNVGLPLGLATTLSGLVQDEWEAIDGYNDAIAALQTLNNTDELITVLKDITTDEYNHVGCLEKALSLIAPVSDNIEAGKAEATEQIRNIKNESLRESISARPFTDKLYELAENDIISWRAIAEAALAFMSDDDVEEMCLANDIDLDIED